VQNVTTPVEVTQSVERRIPGYLPHPTGVRLIGDPGDRDLPALRVKKEKHIIGHEATPGQHFDCEEIGSGHDIHVRTNEFFPGCGLAPLRR
jgi:hypothetical protein